MSSQQQGHAFHLGPPREDHDLDWDLRRWPRIAEGCGLDFLPRCRSHSICHWMTGSILGVSLAELQEWMKFAKPCQYYPTLVQVGNFVFWGARDFNFCTCIWALFFPTCQLKVVRHLFAYAVTLPAAFGSLETELLPTRSQSHQQFW